MLTAFADGCSDAAAEEIISPEVATRHGVRILGPLTSAMTPEERQRDRECLAASRLARAASFAAWRADLVGIVMESVRQGVEEEMGMAEQSHRGMYTAYSWEKGSADCFYTGVAGHQAPP